MCVCVCVCVCSSAHVFGETYYELKNRIVWRKSVREYTIQYCSCQDIPEDINLLGTLKSETPTSVRVSAMTATADRQVK